MMWQKARIATKEGEFAGREFWVEVAPPVLLGGFDCKTGEPCAVKPSFITNLQEPFPPWKLVTVKAESTELLPEFSDAVTFVPWNTFLNGADTESGEKR